MTDFRGLILAALLAAAPLRAGADSHCPNFPWFSFIDPGPQSYTQREDLLAEGDVLIRAFEFGELVGAYAKVFIFIRFDGDCLTRAVSLGSYEMTNLVGAPEGGRIYHLDLYAPDRHATLDFFDALPEYDAIRGRALDALR